MNLLSRLVAVLAIAFVVSACGSSSSGGGGGGGTLTPPPPTIASGVFKDANVEGLEFESGGQSGVTGADGAFTFEVGVPVTFSVGGVVLGTTNGAPVVTPIDLVPNGTSATLAVQNIVRFLLMLDADGDSSNGIQISAAVRERAAMWPPIDFGIDDFNGNTDVQFAQSDAQSADGGTHVIPGLAEAQAHLEGTFLCVYSGAYLGTYSGDDSGFVGVLVDPRGVINGVGVSDSAPDLQFTITGGSIDPASGTSLVVGTTDSGATFEGGFDSVNDISGTWAGEMSGETGTFEVSRIGGASDAVYRFSGVFESDEGSVEFDAGVLLFDLDAADQIDGIAYTVVFDELVAVTGSLSGSTLTAMTPDGTDIEGVVDLDLLTTNGTWNDGQGNFGSFEGLGCALN